MPVTPGRVPRIEPLAPPYASELEALLQRITPPGAFDAWAARRQR